VDALSMVVADFDQSAQSAGLTRDAALEQMTGTDFLARRRQDMERTIARHDRLRADLGALEAAPPLRRSALLHRFGDAETLHATASVYRPALPLTLGGLTFGLAGLVLGSGTASGLLRLLKRQRNNARA
jgi:hypothetical protein